MKLPVRNTLIVLQAVVILLLLIFRNNGNVISKEEQDLKVQQYLAKEQRFKSKIDDLGRELSSQKEVLINKDKKLEKLLLENTDLTRLISQVKFDSETKINNLLSKYKSVEYITSTKIDTIYKDGQIVIVNSIDTLGVSIGSKFENSDKWFKINGQIEKQGIKLDSLSIFNSYVVTIGTKKESLFKPRQTYVELFNENPYTRTLTLNNIRVIEKKKWYEKGILKFAGGLLVGSVATFIITK
jgi:hypothetical protein